ncbi:MAG TPA: DUF4350 domain-containing protein [Candidatus Thermoplasmatota archaeon]|nr:DUF4350 domain-containing protein [Candidatus Thermoplasmatota archaeon]
MKLPTVKLEPRTKRLVGLSLAAILVVVPLALLIPWGSSARYSAYDEGSDHLSEFRALFPEPEYATRAIVSTPLLLRDVADPAGHLYVAAGVEREYTEDEVEAIVDFAGRGGALLVMDDFQKANPLAARFGVQFDGAPLFDARFNGSRDFVRVDASVRSKAYPNLLLNGPSTLSIAGATGRVTVLAESSRDSYTDVDGSGNVTDDDRAGPFPVAAAVTDGADRVVAVFIADAGLFGNDVLANEDHPLFRNANRAFARALLPLLLPDGQGTVYFDESRHASGLAEPSYRFLALAVGAARSPVGVGLLAVAGLGAAALLVAAGLRDADRRHLQQLTARTPREMPVDAQRARLRALVLGKLDSQANVTDPAAFVRDHRAEAERLLGDAALTSFVANPDAKPGDAEWRRILDAGRRYLE